MSKIEIQKSIGMFLCPICGKKMKVYDSSRIACSNKHSFDLSRKGYVNLLSGSAKTDYDKKMLESRNLICKSSFYEPMIEQISSLILKRNQKENSDNIKILDAGCGEGSHLAQIASNLTANSTFSVMGFGIDISRDGIQIALRDYPDVVWCVGDLARLPFAGKQFDVILSILSPSNYTEFNRVSSDNGINYLKELRSHFYNKTDKETYSNEKVIEHFRSNLSILDLQQIQYTLPINRESLEHLINMTPLSWRVPREKVKDILSIGIDSISVDLSIIVGARKKRK